MRSRSIVGLPQALVVLSLVSFAGCVHSRASRPTSQDDPIEIGYGSQPRSRVVTAISSLGRDQIDDQHAVNMVELLERIPGLRVERGGDGYSLRVRGASDEPLVVVDGTPLFRGVAALLSIRPSDIHRIDVLKDAGATAPYGVRGANGVILVTMRYVR
jgi:TonB-dependent SusC/RagA subfamily outer membrane receptor